MSSVAQAHDIHINERSRCAQVSLSCDPTYLAMKKVTGIRHYINLLLTDINDHFAVKTYLKNLDPYKLTQLGEALGLACPNLKMMSNVLECMTAAWLNREDNVLERSGEPSWSTLTDALERMGQREIAEDIRRHTKHKKENGRGSSNSINSKYSYSVAGLIKYNVVS